jgi:ribosome biogenesis protein UTP30
MHGMGHIKVIGYTRLRKEHKPHEAKRLLCDSYDLFLADDRITPLLPKCLGKTFFNKKKQPVSVNLKRPNLKTELEKAIRSTYLFVTGGPCTSIKVGTVGMTAQEIVENVVMVVPEVVSHIPKKWKNVQSLQIKTKHCISLPIWNSLPDEVGVIATKDAMEE